MRSERLIVVGGVAAGLSAASRARRVDPYLEIVVYEKGPDISYSACGLPYFIAGQVPDPNRLRVYSPEFFRTQRNIQVLTGHEVTEVSTSRRRVTVIPPGGAPLEEVPYDRLVLSTGAEPARPDAPGLDLEGVFHVNDLQAALKLERWLDAERPRRALIIGGGYIGLEMADALVARGLEVTLADRGPRLFEAVDEEISSLVEQELAAHGVRVLKTTALAALTGGRDRRVRRAVFENGSQPGEETDCVVLATGVRPRVKLAEVAGIILGATGAIAVDDAMSTSAAAVFAAGDCVETRHRVSGRPVYFPLGTTANKQGRVAGENAAGGRARFAGIVGTAVVKVFNQEVGRTGLSREEAEAAGFTACAASIRAPARSRYLGGQDIVVRVLADRASGRLLGAQMAGPEGVAKRIDVFATALQARMTVDEANQLDLSYAPPFSSVWDPILIALQEMRRELSR